MVFFSTLVNFTICKCIKHILHHDAHMRIANHRLMKQNDKKRTAKHMFLQSRVDCITKSKRIFRFKCHCFVRIDFFSIWRFSRLFSALYADNTKTTQKKHMYTNAFDYRLIFTRTIQLKQTQISQLTITLYHIFFTHFHFHFPILSFQVCILFVKTLQPILNAMNQNHTHVIDSK